MKGHVSMLNKTSKGINVISQTYYLSLKWTILAFSNQKENFYKNSRTLHNDAIIKVPVFVFVKSENEPLYVKIITIETNIYAKNI